MNGLKPISFPLLVVFMSVLVAGCGGSGGSNKLGGVETPDNIFDQLPDPGDYGDLGNFGGLNQPDTGFETPAIRTLNWPSDFPADIGAGLTDTVLVRGLPTGSAYDFDITLPPVVDNEETALFVMNLSDDQQVGGQVCTGDPDCTGTVNFPTVSLQLVSFDSGMASIAITTSATRALVNEGSIDEPVSLSLSGGEIRYTGTVAAPIQTAQQIIAGQSFYQLDGFVPDDRYEIELTSESERDLEMAVSYSDGSDVQCDPSYSGSYRCILVVSSDVVDLNVVGNFALFGAEYTIEVSRLTDASKFEGTWHTPIALQVPGEEPVYHFGQSDNYSSYYEITGLDPERQYKIVLSGNTSPVRMKRNSPITSLPVYAPECSPLDDDNSTGEQVCLIEQASHVYFRVESVSKASDYLLSVETGVADEGSAVTPVLLQLDGQSRLLHHGTVSSNSFYKIEGFIPDQKYLLQTNSNGRRLDLSVSTPGSNSVDCNGSFHSDCVFTASDYELNLTVTDSQDGIGRPFVLSVVPADRPTTVYPEPVFEDMDLNYAALPHTGTVGSYFSNYRVTGLMPNQHYLVTISQNSEPMSLSVWPGSATTIQCRFEFQHPFGESCSSNADSNGVINIRVGGDDAGGQFTFDLVEAQLRSEHRSSDTPMVVPENSVPGAVSTITINDNEPADIVEVELQIEHGYTEDLEIILEAPDGQRVVLADHVPGTSFRNTIYSDLAELPNISEYGSRTHVLKTYRPNGFLHLLQGMSISGNWRLYVTDDRSTNISDALGGILHGWGLSFKSLAP